MWWNVWSVFNIRQAAARPQQQQTNKRVALPSWMFSVQIPHSIIIFYECARGFWKDIYAFKYDIMRDDTQTYSLIILLAVHLFIKCIPPFFFSIFNTRNDAEHTIHSIPKFTFVFFSKRIDPFRAIKCWQTETKRHPNNNSIKRWCLVPAHQSNLLRIYGWIDPISPIRGTFQLNTKLTRDRAPHTQKSDFLKKLNDLIEYTQDVLRPHI